MKFKKLIANPLSIEGVNITADTFEVGAVTPKMKVMLSLGMIELIEVIEPKSTKKK